MPTTQGGALDAAAELFTNAYDSRVSAVDFVNNMRKKNELIPGIGHRVKSIDNPDSRVVLLKKYAKDHFPSTELLDYAIEVEKITTLKKSNLILNVDGTSPLPMGIPRPSNLSPPLGCVAASFVDLLRSCGAFSLDEANEYIKGGVLNGLFVLGTYFPLKFSPHHC